MHRNYSDILILIHAEFVEQT